MNILQKICAGGSGKPGNKSSLNKLIDSFNAARVLAESDYKDLYYHKEDEIFYVNLHTRNGGYNYDRKDFDTFIEAWNFYVS